MQPELALKPAQTSLCRQTCMECDVVSFNIYSAGFSFYNSGAKASKVQSVAAGSASAYVGPVSPMELEQASHLIFQVDRIFLCTLSQSCCSGMHKLDRL